MRRDASKSPTELLMQSPLGGWIRFVRNLPFIFIGLCAASAVMFLAVAIMGDVRHDGAGAVVTVVAIAAGLAAGIFCKRRFSDRYWQQTRGITIVSSTWQTSTSAVATTQPWYAGFDPLEFARTHAKPLAFGLAAIVLVAIGGAALSSYRSEPKQSADQLRERQIAERRSAQDRARGEREARATSERQAALERQREMETRGQQRTSLVAEAHQLRQRFLDQLPMTAQGYCNRTAKTDLQCREFILKAKALFEQQVSLRCATYSEPECLTFLRNPLRQNAN